ncbi:MAG: tandem-95 repeat protein [Deltaproteobacteria bacterium]|nr:tandem-95 repeat protein [Deltaproteobacteria bacterium]
MRRAPLHPISGILLGALALTALGTPARALDIERTSSANLYIDGADRGAYAAYRVTNDDGVDYPGVWVTLGGWRPGAHIGLAPREDGVAFLGPLARGQARTAYFYLVASRPTLFPERHDVSAFTVDPTRAPEVAPIAWARFRTGVEVSALAADVRLSRVDLAPLPPVLGGELTVTATGRIPEIHGTRELVFSPAARVDWPADALELVATRLVIPDEVTLTDALVWTAPREDHHGREVRFTYTFRAACAAGETAVAPVVWIDPGCPYGHNDPSLTAVAMSGPTTSALALTRAPAEVGLHGSGVVRHRLMVNNLSDQAARLDALFDALTPVDGPTGEYLPGTTTLDGATFADPELDGATLAWFGAFVVMPGESLELAYEAAYPAHLGVFEHRAWGEVRAAKTTCDGRPQTRIDTTLALDDDAPALARVEVFNHAPSLPERTFWAAVGAAQIVVPDLGAGFADVDGDGLGAITLLASDGAAAMIDGEALVLRPHHPMHPGTLVVTLEACDDGDPFACTMTRLVVVVNDPPSMRDATLSLAWREAVDIPIVRLVADLGAIVGDDPADGDLDGLGGVMVSPSPKGPWSDGRRDGVTLALGARCGVGHGGVIQVRAGERSGQVGCWVQVCEELPAADDAVCARAALTLQISQCRDDADCRGAFTCSDGACVDRGIVKAIDDAFHAPTGLPLLVVDPARGLMGNDLIPAGAEAYVDVVAGSGPEASEGDLALAPDGTFRFVPARGFRGAATFAYRLVVMGHGVDDGQVVITVSGEAPDVNTAPVARDDLVAALEDTPRALDVLANDLDLDGDPLVVSRIVIAPRHGRAALVDGDVWFAPAPDWYGDDALGYEVCDDRGACDAARVDIMVAPVDDPPFALDDRAETPEDTPVLVNVLANDFDVEGDALEVVSVVPDKALNLASGRPTLLPDGTILFAPGPDRVGPLYFGYTVCDASGACSDALGRVDVTPVADAPLAGDDGLVIVPDRVTLLPVLDNDADADGDALTVTRVVEAPRYGRAILIGHTLAYVSRGHALVDRLVYEACDPSGRCAEAEARLLVGMRPGPSAIDDVVYGDGTRPVVVDVLDNDRIVGRDAIDALWVTQPADPHGTARVTDDGLVVYTPDHARATSESFTYTACDFRHACSTARVVVELELDDRAPIALDTLTTAVVGTVTQVFALTGAHDADGDALVIDALTPARHGEVTLPEFDPPGPDRVFYTPAPKLRGRDDFTVSVADPAGGRSQATVVLHVMPQENRAPIARDDRVHVRMAPTSSVIGYTSEIGVRMNDQDADNDPLVIVVAVMPEHGTVRLSERGNPLYTPLPGYFGPDRFAYAIEDGHGARAHAVVELVVGDRDEDGLSDFDEGHVTFTDPNDADTDDDGVDDVDDPRPLDADADDDGLADGVELFGLGPLAAYGPTNPLVADSDGDHLPDGLEVGVLHPVPGGTSDVTMRLFAGTELDGWMADVDPVTQTDPTDADSDDDGLLDGYEDLNRDGAWWGTIGATGSPGLGETDPRDPDTDGDGLADGLELGLVAPQGEGTDLVVFRPDLDPSTRTNPRDLDSDDGSVFDGDEDLDRNGRLDAGEIDPTWGVDDVQGRVTGGGAGCTGGAAGLPWLFGLLGLALVCDRARRTGPARQG